MSVTVEIRPPHPGELQAVRQLRYDVLDHDKGLPLRTASPRDDDPASIHMAAFLPGGRVIATVRLEPTEPGSTTYRVRRMATAEGYRGRGIGSRVLAAAEAEAKRRGATGIELHARVKACPFYVRAGFTDTGGRPVHDGDTNIGMFKRL